MKLIISADTVNTINTEARAALLEVGVDQDVAVGMTTTTADTSRKYISLTQEGNDWVYTVDDTTLIRALHMYVRIAKLVYPLINPLKTMFASISEELEACYAYINTPR